VIFKSAPRVFTKLKNHKYETQSPPLRPESSGELDVSAHDGNSLAVNSTKIGVLEESNKVCLGSFLKGKNGGRLPSEFTVVIIANFPDESLERKFSQKELSGFLVPSNLSEGDRTGSEPMGPLNPTPPGMSLPCSLPGKSLLGLLG